MKKKMPLWAIVIIALVVMFFGYNFLGIISITARGIAVDSLIQRARRTTGDQKTLHMEYFSNIISIASLKLPYKIKEYNIDNYRKKFIAIVIYHQK